VPGSKPGTAASEARLGAVVAGSQFEV